MNSHYFDTSPSSPSRSATVRLALPDLTLDLVTDRSVFSGGRIDPGTKYLLQEVPLPAASVRHALDLGCGYGPIALVMALRAPGADVWAVDINARAIDLCERNVQLASAEASARVHPVLVSDDRPFGDLPPDRRFDLIWSNPPIRIGKPALHALLNLWLERLADGGIAYLVVQKHLGSDSLQQWLTATGRPTRRIGSRAGYRLLEVRPDDAGHAPTGDPT